MTDISDLVKPLKLSERVNQAILRDRKELLDKCQHVITVCREKKFSPLSIYSSAGGSNVLLDREEFRRAFPECNGDEVVADGIVFMCLEDL